MNPISLTRKNKITKKPPSARKTRRYYRIVNCTENLPIQHFNPIEVHKYLISMFVENSPEWGASTEIPFKPNKAGLKI